MIGGFFKTLAQFEDRALRRVLVRSLLLTLALYVMTWIAIGTALGAADGTAFAQTIAGYIGETGVDILLGAGFLGALVLTLLFLPVIVVIVLGFFLEDVADAVEARHYPGLPAPRQQPLIEAIGSGLKFATITIALNLLALPLYFVPGLNLILFYSINGYLLGREMQEMVALRRLDPKAVRADRKAAPGTTFGIGAVGTFLTTLPLINLVAPILSAGAMVHAFNRRHPSGAFTRQGSSV